VLDDRIDTRLNWLDARVLRKPLKAEFAGSDDDGFRLLVR
jgi:hypothetical protein